jgi:PAS domain S-box-containing protein
MSKKLSVLVIEDNEEDALQNVRYLQEAGYEIHFSRVETENEMRSAMAAQKWDLILSDYLMPRFSVPAALKLYKDSDCDIPFIVISGAIGDKKAVTMMKAGAHDYFLKDNMTRFVTAVERELREADIRKEKKHAQQNLLIQHTLSLKLNRTSDLGIALKEVVETMHQVQGIDLTRIYLNDSGTGTLEHVNGKEFPREDTGIPFPSDKHSGFMNMVRDGHPVYLQFPEICRQLNIPRQKEEPCACAVLPILSDGQCLGVLVCASLADDEFPFGTKMTIESIVSQIGGTIARIQTVEMLKKHEFKYRLLAENASDMIWMVGLDMKPIFFSPSVTRLLGYTVDEAMDNPVGKVYAPSSLESAMETLTDELIHDAERKPDRTLILEMEMIKKDGTAVIVEANYTFLRDEKRKPIGILTIARDITERKQAEEDHQKSEMDLLAIMNSCTESIFLVDPDGTLLAVNEGLGIRLGLDPGKITGKNIRDILPPEVANYRQLKIDHVIHTGEPIHFEDERSGRTILNSLYPVSSPDGKITKVAGFGLDITDRILAEKKLIHAARMAGLGELASGIAHEINQPLNTISLIMDNLLAEAGRDEIINGKYLKNKSERIFENITRMRNIIDHIRAFSRSQDDCIPARFDINSSIRNALSMISEQFRHAGIGLDIALDEQLPELTGNTIKFEEVILNLLANAMDAVLEKGHKVTGSQGHIENENFEMKIGIRSFRENKHLVVEVIDNGIGIKDEDVDQIMLPFYTTKESGKGTGLGLSISYQIISEMNGTIEISSQWSIGTTIKVIIPPK